MKLSKLQIIIGSIAVLVIAVIGIISFQSNVEPSFGVFEINNFSAVNHSTATTTADTLPVQALSVNHGRKYALIQNHSDTDVYLFFVDVTASTTGITDLNAGTKLVSGGSYEILPENLYTGYVFVTSTVSNKAVGILESN